MAREGVYGVAVLLVPVVDLPHTPCGLIIIRRDVEPQKGKLALPGGFIDPTGETWQEACAREAREESSEILNVDANTIRHFMTRSTLNNLLLVFGVAPPIPLQEFAQAAFHFTPNKEVTEVSFITRPTELAFPLHTEAVRMWFDQAQL